jgi:hypothetical protein
LNLPKAVRDLHAVRKGSSVSLTWTIPTETTDGTLIKKQGKMILRRSTDDGRSASVVRESPLPPALKADASRKETFQDSLADLLGKSSADFALYTVEALNNGGKGYGLSNQAVVPLVATMSAPTVQAKASPRGISISWNQAWPPQNPTRLTVQYAYKIMRRLQGSALSTMVAQVGLSNSAMAFVDESIEWEKSYQYWITPVTLWQQNPGNKGEVEGDDSAPVTVLAHDSFPPSAPVGLQAVFSGDPQRLFIDLTWTPNTEPDLAGYNVYRRSDSGTVKINTDLVKTPSFRDTAVESGMKYFYSVSAVDLRNNESARSGPASETVPR